MSREYRLVIEKHYVVQARSYDEALQAINSEREYNYVVNEILTLLSEKEESKECPLCETGYEHNHEKEEAE